MVTILFRTLITYFFLMLTMRLMGKRQIGELEVTDLVTTLLLSEISSLPLTNPETPILHALLPMGILLVLEVASSWILVRAPRLRRLVSAQPTVIIHRGKLLQGALISLRISMDELMSEIRQQGYTDPGQIECAILEKNGKLTVLPKPAFAQPTVQQLGLKPASDGLMHIVLRDGVVSREGLALIGKSRDWLEGELKRHRLTPDRLFCVLANENGRLHWIEKEKDTP